MMVGQLARRGPALQRLRSFEPNFFLSVSEIVQLYLLVGLDVENIFEYAPDATLRNIQIFGHFISALGRISLQPLLNFPHRLRSCRSLMRGFSLVHFGAAGSLETFYGAIYEYFINV